MPFLLAIEDVFSITGRKRVATGHSEGTHPERQGELKEESFSDMVDIVGLRETGTTTVTGIKMFKKTIDQTLAGGNVGLLFRGIQKAHIQRGMILAEPGTITPHTKFVGIVYVLKKEKGGRHSPFFAGYKPQFYLTTDVTGNVTKVVNDSDEETKMVMPEDRVTMVVELFWPVASEQGIRFAIGDGDRTVGASVIQSIVE